MVVMRRTRTMLMRRWPVLIPFFALVLPRLRLLFRRGSSGSILLPLLAIISRRLPARSLSVASTSWTVADTSWHDCTDGGWTMSRTCETKKCRLYMGWSSDESQRDRCLLEVKVCPK